jgi:hypothetical protein
MGVEYIRGNPAIESFKDGLKAANDRRAADMTFERDKQRLDEDTQSAPHRISRVKADGRLATTAADIAEANKGADIKIRYNTAERGGLENQGLSVDLHEKRTTSPSRIGATVASNEATKEQAPISTERARTEQTERAQTSPLRVQQEKDRTVVIGGQARDTSMKALKEVVKLLDEGRTAEAEEVARRSGETIPEQLKSDAGFRRALKDATDDAERWYPNRPAAQLKHVKTIMEEAKTRGGANVTATSPRLDALPGLPAPSETSTNKGGTALQQNVDFLKSRGIAKDDTDAFRLLNQSKNDYQGTVKELYRDEYKRRTEAAKGPGGFGVVDNKTLNDIDNAAMAAAVANAKRLRQISDEVGVINTPAAKTLATGEQPLQQPAPEPEKPKRPAESKPWYQFWKSGDEGTKAEPVKTSGSAPSIREFQNPPKAQERAPGGAPAAGATTEIREDQRALAQQASPEAIREAARKQIADGKDRSLVLRRLQQLGVDTTGL